MTTNYEEVIQSVRARSVPVHTSSVGWSEKTRQLLDILKQNNPYQDLPDTVTFNLNRIRKMPELRDYLPWFAIGPGFKEIYAEELNPTPQQPTFKDYCEY